MENKPFFQLAPIYPIFHFQVQPRFEITWLLQNYDDYAELLMTQACNQIFYKQAVFNFSIPSTCLEAKKRQETKRNNNLKSNHFHPATPQKGEMPVYPVQ